MSGPAERRATAALMAAVFAVVLAVYLGSGRVSGYWDTLPARYLPLSLLNEGDLDLDEFDLLHGEEARRRFWLLEGVPPFLKYERGHYVSRFSPFTASLATPVYAAALPRGIDPVEGRVARTEKLAASVLAALSASFVFGALAAVCTRGWAIALTAVYAFGTSTFSICSQALWEHTGAVPCLALFLMLLSWGNTSSRLPAPLLAGMAGGMAVACRLSDLLLVAPLALYAWRHHATARWRFAVGAAVPALLLFAYNAHYFGSPLATGRDNSLLPGLWGLHGGRSLAGLLVSPSRGLLIYTPIAILSALALARAARQGPPLLRYAGAGVLMTLALYSCFWGWWGSGVFGPRFLADLSPILCYSLHVFTPPTPRRWFAPVFGVLAAASVAVHSLGAFVYDNVWDAQPPIDLHRERLWSWRDGQLVYYGQEVLAHWQRRTDRARLASDSHPDSRHAPHLLASSLEVQEGPTEVPRGQTVRVVAKARNTGRAAWLPLAEGSAGAVRLGWWWSRDGVELATPAGRTEIRTVVFPGDERRLVAWCAPPARPGTYTLHLRLVSENVAWFGAAAALPVQVTSARRVHPE